MSLSLEQPASPVMEDAEAQMRRALGLFGDTPRSRPENERPETPRGGGGFMQGVHRRRFVQDGEVPVTVVRRDASDSPHASAAAATPTSSRLQRVEAALQAESAARDRAERALSESQAALQALRTKIGHNELATNEAVAAAKRDREALAELREGMAADADRLREAEERAEAAEDELGMLRRDLAEERRARARAERLLDEPAREPELALDYAAPRPQAARTEAEPVRVPARRGRPPLVRPAPVEEGEPVKWWLLPDKAAGKRR